MVNSERPDGAAAVGLSGVMAELSGTDDTL
jgi:hypothetical protein